MKSKPLLYLIAIFSGIILLYSGCKVKSKSLKTAQLTDNSYYHKLDSSHTAVFQNYSKALQDSSTRESHEKSDRKIKRTIDISINLDSSSIKADSSGNIHVGELVNRAIRNAKSLSIKIQEEISEHHENNDRLKTGTAGSSNLDSKQVSDTYSKVDDQKKIKSSSKESAKTKDSSPAAGASWWWIIKGLALISLGIFVYYKFKKS
jgi:cobalamin biosynthesis Mg chelatase CobN